MSDENRALIAIKAFSGKGLETLKEAANKINDHFWVVRASSIYKVHRPAESLGALRDIRRVETLEGLVCVVKVRTRKSAGKVLELLRQIEQELQSEVLRKTIGLNLMVFENEVIMQPGLSIPHPEMHLRPEEIIPAVEVWRDYVHPVLNRSLNDISRDFTSVAWGEFFTQSNAVLDFSNLTE